VQSGLRSHVPTSAATWIGGDSAETNLSKVEKAYGRSIVLQLLAYFVADEALWLSARAYMELHAGYGVRQRGGL